MKKYLSLLLVSVFFFSSFFGCGKNVKPGDIDGYDEGETYLSIWVHIIEETPEGQAYLKSVQSFNEHFNGKYFADVEFIPRNDSGGGYSDKVNASVLSGNLPDVLTVDGPNIAAYAANGIIQPLAPMTDEERSVYLNSILTQGTIGNKLYALGAMESSVGLYYNKQILREAGIEVPSSDNPWTFSEFLDILEKLKPIMAEKNGYALDMTFPVGETTIYYYAPFIWSNGGDFVSEDGLTTKDIFDSDTNAETLNYFKTLNEKGYMSSVPISNLFESGRAAFKFDGAWEVNTIYTSYPDIELGVAPYIVGDKWNGERYTPTGSWAYAVSSECDNVEAATELVKWMSGVESSITLYENIKSMPSTYAAYEQISTFTEDENYKALYEQLRDYGRPRPKTPAYPQLSSSFQQTLENVAISGMDAKDELSKAEERISDKLERYTRK